MTDNSDPFASFFEKKDKKAKGKKIKNVVATDELAERLQRAAVREQKDNQSTQPTEGITSAYTTAVEILDEDDDYPGANAVVANLDDQETEDQKLERSNSSTAAAAASKANPWGPPAVNVDSKNAASIVIESSTASSVAAPTAPTGLSGSAEVSAAKASETTADSKLAVLSPAVATTTQSHNDEKKTEPEKSTKFVPSRVREAAMATGQGHAESTQRPTAVASGSAYRAPGFRENSGPLSGSSGGAYKPPGQRGEGGTGAPTYIRRTIAPNIQSENDFPTL